ncbi:MAG TPA: hypothetical protein VHO28_13415 [Ignavibacteriales bacterium]|nr:hypothetical protein [Ignavibacteriales bacterium]
MQGKENMAGKGNKILLESILLSGALHAAVLFLSGVISLPSFHTDPETRYMEMRVVASDFGTQTAQVLQKAMPEETAEKAEQNPSDKTEQKEVKESSGQISDLEFAAAAVDTSSLSQIYKESSFNVSMKYPAGWTYLDQHLDAKLEGVIFWPSAAEINPPPYIHLETSDKEYFYPAKFKKKFVYRDKEYYYNEPSEIGGEWQQSVYVRTGTLSDFVIKVIIKGKDNFNKFLPSFYAIVKSFDFNNNIL